jgi:hypothetical protein
MRHLEKGLCPKQQIHWTTKFWDAWKYHYITFPTTTHHRHFAMGMHGDGISKHPG